jgi:thiol-disulfide isomerase/thioredoxin
MLKRFSFILLIAPSLLAWWSCEEVGPNINFGGGGGSDTTGGSVDSTQPKTVLLEDFTATNCPNCPNASDIIHSLQNQYPGRIEAVSVHQGILSVQLEPDDPILKTQDGEDLADLLGPPAFWPIGTIDRVRWETSPGDFQLMVDRSLWSTYVAQQLDSPLAVLLGLSFDFDEAGRTLTGSVIVNFLRTISDPLNITILITESGIEAAQLDGLTVIPEYVHSNVLRDIVTYFSGDVVTGSKVQGTSWKYSIAPYTVAEEWNADSCRIIAFVSKSAGSYEVLQTLSTPLKD